MLSTMKSVKKFFKLHDVSYKINKFSYKINHKHNFKSLSSPIKFNKFNLLNNHKSFSIYKNFYSTNSTNSSNSFNKNIQTTDIQVGEQIKNNNNNKQTNEYISSAENTRENITFTELYNTIYKYGKQSLNRIIYSLQKIIERVNIINIDKAKINDNPFLVFIFMICKYSILGILCVLLYLLVIKFGVMIIKIADNIFNFGFDYSHNKK